MTDAELVRLADEIECVLLRHVRITKNQYLPSPATNSMSVDLASIREAAEALAAQQDGAREFERVELTKLARCFGVSFATVQYAEGMIGHLYRRLASKPSDGAY